MFGNCLFPVLDSLSLTLETEGEGLMLVGPAAGMSLLHNTVKKKLGFIFIQYLQSEISGKIAA